MSATALSYSDDHGHRVVSCRTLDRILRALRLMQTREHDRLDDIEEEPDYDDSDPRVPPEDDDGKVFERLTKGDVKILVSALRLVVRQEVRRETRTTLRLFVDDKWNKFGKYSAKGIWALVVAALLWLAIVVTHGWKTNF